MALKHRAGRPGSTHSDRASSEQFPAELFGTPTQATQTMELTVIQPDKSIKAKVATAQEYFRDMRDKNEQIEKKKAEVEGLKEWMRKFRRAKSGTKSGSVRPGHKWHITPELEEMNGKIPGTIAKWRQDIESLKEKGGAMLNLEGLGEDYSPDLIEALSILQTRKEINKPNIEDIFAQLKRSSPAKLSEPVQELSGSISTLASHMGAHGDRDSLGSTEKNLLLAVTIAYQLHDLHRGVDAKKSTVSETSRIASDKAINTQMRMIDAIVEKAKNPFSTANATTIMDVIESQKPAGPSGLTIKYYIEKAPENRRDELRIMYRRRTESR